MSEPTRHPDPDGGSTPLPGDELDALLRSWHQQNAERAVAGREALLARLRADSTAAAAPHSASLPPLVDEQLEGEFDASHPSLHGAAAAPRAVVVVRRLSMLRNWPLAAAAMILIALVPILMLNRGGTPHGGPMAMSRDRAADEAAISRASYEGYIMCPDGGRLDARDAAGDLLGPCELRHTDVKADVTGFLTRVTVTQKYHNPHRTKIEAEYTFPLSERAAVDRMVMTSGNRVIEGQVKERSEARRVYEQAKAEGRVASLLEQQRPNIFSQSIANIEPGADIDITISYVETTRQTDGAFEFDFPTTIGPRFIPGQPLTGGDAPPPLPQGLPPYVRPRRGLVLLAPATISEMRPGDVATRGQVSEAQLSQMLRRAIPVQATTPSATIWYSFRAAYPDGSAEFGTIYTDGTGTVNGRWFCVPGAAMAPAPDRDAAGNAAPGAPFSPDTDRVPDASHITPMPSRPGTRAGHEISITVNIDTGGPALGAIASPLHEIHTESAGGHATVTLKNSGDIPNRDFVLKWREDAKQVEPAVFTCNVPQGNFFAIQLLPPTATGDDVASVAVPREVVFVLDVSGSMKDRPIEKAKEVLDKALSSLRPTDTFNIIKFSNSLDTLWPASRPATTENLVLARSFYMQQVGGGGTQMLPAIQAAYDAQRPGPMPRRAGITPMQLANLPADGRRVVVDAGPGDVGPIMDGHGEYTGTLSAGADVTIDLRLGTRPMEQRGAGDGDSWRLSGAWETINGRRVFSVDSSERIAAQRSPHAEPFRLIVFLTDGLIGNENEVLAEIRARRDLAAVFPFAIGNSPNRYLLDSMAREGRGEVEYVLDTTNADEAIARFARRIQTPVLTNIHVEFSPNLNVLDVMTVLGGGGGAVAPMDAIPDLFDVKPLTIVGRYNQPGTGTVTISGTSADGPYRRIVNLDLPEPAPNPAEPGEFPSRILSQRDTIATLWARAKVESVMGQDLRGALAGNFRPELRSQVITLGESFNLLTQFTSFVAVDRLRVTVGGKPRLVHIPVELPEGTNYTGFFGPDGATDKDLYDDMVLGYTAANGLLQQRVLMRDGKYDFAVKGRTKEAVDEDRRTVLPEIRPMEAKPVELKKEAERAVRQIEQTPGSGAAAPASVPMDAEKNYHRSAETRGRATPPARSEAARPSLAPGAAAKPYEHGQPAPANTPAPEVAMKPDAGLAKQPEPSDRVDVKDAIREQLEGLRTGGKSPDSEKSALFFGLITPDIQAGAPLRWKVNQIDAENTDDVAKVLTLYSALEPSPATPAAEEPHEAAAGAAGATATSHDSGAAGTTGQSDQRVVLAEHVIIRIGDLVRAGKGEEAQRLAGALAAALPDDADIVELDKSLSDPTITPEERTRILDEQVTAAKARLEAVLRDARLRSRLTPELYALANSPDAPVPAEVTVLDSGILVTLLVTDAGQTVREGLVKTGLHIESADETARVIVGTVPATKLKDVGASDGVRCMEPTH